MTSNLIGGIMVLTAAVLWSLVGLVIKTVSASIVWIILIRSLTAGIIFLPFVFRKPIRPFRMNLISGFFYGLLCLTFAVTTRLSSSAMAVSMQYAAPVYLIGLTFIKEKRIPLPKLATFLCLAAGLLLNMFDALKAAPLAATLTGLLIGISFLLYTYYMQKIESGSPFGVVSILNFTAALCFIPILPFQLHPMPADGKTVATIILSGIIISAVSYAFYSMGLARINLESAMIITLAEPILNPIWVFLATKEVPNTLTILGFGFILTGTVLDILNRIFLSSKQKGS